MKTLAKTLLMNLISFLILQNVALAEERHNISNNPIGSVFGFPNIEYSYKVFNHMTIGIMGSAGKIKVNDFDIKGSSVGLVTRIYLEPAFQNNSWYLVGLANQIRQEASIDDHATIYSGKIDQAVFSGGLGYHWFWTGFNKFNLNIGALLSDQSAIELKDSEGRIYQDNLNTKIGAEINIGWRF